MNTNTESVFIRVHPVKAPHTPHSAATRIESRSLPGTLVVRSMFGYRTRLFIREGLARRTLVCDTARVTGNEFLRKLRKLGRRKGISIRFDPAHGDGSHGRVYYGNAFATLKDVKKGAREGPAARDLRPTRHQCEGTMRGVAE